MSARSSTAAVRRAARRARSGAAGRAARGFSLIEMLVVIVLFSFGLLGLVALQARATQTSVTAEDSTRAALLAGEVAAAMWAQKNVALPTATLDAWRARAASPTDGGLPNGDIDVEVDAATKVATITVQWRPPHRPADRSHRYVTEVVIP